MRGKLTNAITGEPITKATITLSLEQGRGSSALRPIDELRTKDGSFEVHEIPQQPCFLRVDAPGFHPFVTKTWELPPGDYELDIQLKPLRSLDLRLVDGARVPIELCELHMPDPYADWIAPNSSQEFVWNFTVRDGRFTRDDLLPGPLDLTIFSEGREWNFQVDLTQQPDGPQTLVLD